MSRNTCNLFEGFTLKELLSENGLEFDIAGNEFDEDENVPPFNPIVNLTGDDLLKGINMHEFLDENDCDENSEIPLSLGLNFERIKEKLKDLTPDGKVKKLIRQEGVGEVVPNEAYVTIQYSGYFEGQDEPYDSTYTRRSPGRYHLNQGELIFGFDLAIQSMKKNELAIFWMDYTYAYGELGCPPLIPPKSDVMFIVSLVDFLDSGSVNNYENLTAAEQKNYANVKLQINSLFKTAADSFKRRKYKQAIRDYKRIINRLEDAELEDENEEQEMKKHLSRARQNLAICYNKEELPRLACMECHAATHKTAKIHFHHGRALIKMGEYKEALAQLEDGLKLNPRDKTIIREISLANELQKKYAVMEKKMWSNCLNQGKDNEKGKEDPREQIAREFVKTFVEDEAVMRQEIPIGVSPVVVDFIHKHAAAAGLNISKTMRYNKETKYLTKPEYY